MRFIGLMRAGFAGMAPAGLFDSATACQGRTVLFEDHFDKMVPSWGEADEGYRVDQGRLLLAQDTDQALYAANTTIFATEIAYCVTVTTIHSFDPENSYAGVLFWYVDDGNFYMLQILPNGTAAVWSRIGGRVRPLVPGKAIPEMKSGDGAVNAVEVMTSANRATISINGEPVGSIQGAAPVEGQRIGVFAVSSQTGASSYAFDDVVVARPWTPRAWSSFTRPDPLPSNLQSKVPIGFDGYLACCCCPGWSHLHVLGESGACPGRPRRQNFRCHHFGLPLGYVAEIGDCGVTVAGADAG